MTISLFLLLCLGAILFLVALPGGSVVRPGQAPQRRRVFVLIWTLLAGAAIWTVNRYIYPADKVNVFGNTDYHVLRHKGFQFRDSLILADRMAPETALWDDLDGYLTVGQAPFALVMDSFFHPFFLREEGGNRLKNNIYPSLDAREGFELRQGDSLLLALRIAPYESGDSLQYRVRFGPNEPEALSDFNRPIRYGYPIADILRYTPGWQTHDSIVNLLTGAWLLRTEQGESESALALFPSRKLYRMPELYLAAGGKTVIGTTGSLAFRIPVAPEQDFFTGLGLSKSPVLHLRDEERGGRLAFDFPEMYRLAHDPENQLFLCSDLRDVAQNVVQGGFLLSQFAEADNHHHINASLRYSHGSARERLRIQVADHYRPGNDRAATIAGGQEFTLQIRDPGKPVEWIMELSDLRSSNALGRWHLIGFIFGFWGLVLVTVEWIGPHRLNVIEMALYVVIFGFLLVRLLLQWRMGAFPPVEDAGPRTFALLRSLRHFNLTVGTTLGFFLLRWTFLKETDHLNDALEGFWRRARRMFSRQQRSLNERLQFNLRKRWTKAWRHGRPGAFFLAYLAPWLAVLLGIALIKVLDLERLERFVNIAAPVALFLFAEWTIEHHRNESQDRYLGLNPYSLFNALLVLVLLAISDAGFGIIFLLFSLIFQMYRTLLRPGISTRRSGLRRNLGPALAAGASFVLVLLGADDFINFVFARTSLFYWALLGPVLLGSALYFAAVIGRDFRPQRRTLVLGGTATGIALLLVLFSGPAMRAVEGFSYVKYRAAIHHDSPDAIIQEERFASGSIGEIMRAAQNQWLINTYLRAAEPEEGREVRYFHLRPHFNKGSSYTTQTTDLVVTRYLISEHGVGVVILLIGLLLAVTAIYSFRMDLPRQVGFVPFGVLLLLFTIALFIWLTATNRFIFFGQDFPLISLTSLFTLVFTLGLFLVVIRTLPEDRSGRMWVRDRGNERRLATSLPLLLLLGVGLALQQSRRELNEANFNFNVSLDQARADFNELNGEFRAFQNTVPEGLAPDSLVAQFHRSRRDSVMSRQAFTQSIYENFVREEKDKMNPDHLLYLVQRPERGRLRYRFALNPTYYLIRPPQENRQAWSGNLLAAEELTGGVYLVGQEGARLRVRGDSARAGLEVGLPPHQNPLRLAAIPASWLRAERPALIVWLGQGNRESAEFSITEADRGNLEQRINLKEPATRLKPGEVLGLQGPKGGQLRFRFEEDFKEFLAKNIWLNGDQRLFYPLGDQLLWSYYYAEAVRNAFSNTPKRKRDQRVSIDLGLAHDLYEIAEEHFRKNNWNRQRLGLTVLNSAGQIRALTDYTPVDAINPNDIDEIHEKNREFHLRRNNHDERATFGNLNLLKLPNGTGSTIKPIIYAAVTSQYELGWARLRTIGIPVSRRDKIRDPEAGILHYYGGKRVEIAWSGIGDQDFEPKTNRDYLVQSKNLYHSLIMFLGAYRRAELAQQKSVSRRDSEDGTIFMPAWVKRDSVDFPVLDLGDGPVTFRPERWPRSNLRGDSYFGDAGSLLGDGLFLNLGLPTYRVRSGRRRDYVDIDPAAATIYANAGPGNRLYAYPELPHFYQQDRALAPSNPLWFIQGMRQPAAGNDPVVVTPLKMAEMSGRLFSGNRLFRATLADSASSEYAAWRSDSISWGTQGFHAFRRDHIFTSLRDVMTMGTAARLGRKLRRGKPPWYYYGKTGTIGDAENPDRNPDKLLMLVISRGDVTEMDPAELADNRFYVLYFTGIELFEEGKMEPVWEMLAELTKAVENSYLFNSYMQDAPTETK
ncbi:MAG: hypothetical protein AAGN35_13385 [Bacteroidota bacterium]